MPNEADKKKLKSIIPTGCRLNWDKRTNRYYVFKSTYVYDPKIKRGREKRTQVGIVVDGKFSYAKSYLLKQRVHSLEEKINSADNRKAVQTVRTACEEEISDTRQAGKVVYPLAYVYLVSLLSSLSGQTNCVQIADYWKNNRPALESIFEDFPKQDISHDTVRRLLMLIDPDQFQSFYGKLVKPLMHQFTTRVVAVDGQAVRATKSLAQKNGKYILTFYDTDNGIALGQKLIGEKHNEITYAADMVEGLDLRGSIVTADALNTQEKFATKLIEQGADYCLAVKQNQKTLYYDIRLCFVERLETRTLEIEKIELGHGRIETRRISVLPGNALKAGHLKKWIGLEEGTIIKATTDVVNKASGQISSLDRYFICSLNWSDPHIAEQCARAVRRHWGIENDLHYVLDVDFYQDRTQCKNANYLQNRVLLNKWALGVIRQAQRQEENNTGKTAKSVKRYMAQFNTPRIALEALSRII